MSEEKQHKRRVHYSGKYPKKFEEKYKELNPDKYSDTMIYNIAFVCNGAIWLDNERGARYFGYNFKR